MWKRHTPLRSWGTWLILSALAITASVLWRLEDGAPTGTIYLIPGTWTFDCDSGRLTGDASDMEEWRRHFGYTLSFDVEQMKFGAREEEADLWWEIYTEDDAALVGLNDTQMALLQPGQRFSDFSTLPGLRTKLPLSDFTFGLVAHSPCLAVRTRSGRVFVYRILQTLAIDDDLGVDFADKAKQYLVRGKAMAHYNLVLEDVTSRYVSEAGGD